MTAEPVSENGEVELCLNEPGGDVDIVNGGSIMTIFSASCLCGSVKFSVVGAIEPPDACHCTQCRKQSGHVWASTDVLRKNLNIEGDEHVTWFDSSKGIRRGFCSLCGSVLFWDKPGSDQTSVSMGAFDSPTGTHLSKHIFVADKGDYYDIADGLPQNDQ